MPLPAGLTNIPPKRLALIAGGGVAAGLAWRYYSSRKSTTTQVGADGNPIDVSKLALAENSAGNLAATQAVPNPNDAFRDTGGAFPIPVQKGIVTGADGIDYLIDATGKVLGPLVTRTSTNPENWNPHGGVPVGTTPSTSAPAAVTPGIWTQAYSDWYDKLHSQYPASGYDSNLNVGDTIPTDWQNPYFYSYEAAKAVADRGYI